MTHMLHRQGTVENLADDYTHAYDQGERVQRREPLEDAEGPGDGLPISHREFRRHQERVEVYDNARDDPHIVR